MNDNEIIAAVENIGAGIRHQLKSMSVQELEAVRRTILDRKASDPSPGKISWDAHPQGWMNFQAWQRRSLRRFRTVQAINRHLAAK